MISNPSGLSILYRQMSTIPENLVQIRWELFEQVHSLNKKYMKDIRAAVA